MKAVLLDLCQRYQEAAPVRSCGPCLCRPPELGWSGVSVLRQRAQCKVEFTPPRNHPLAHDADAPSRKLLSGNGSSLTGKKGRGHDRKHNATATLHRKPAFMHVLCFSTGKVCAKGSHPPSHVRTVSTAATSVSRKVRICGHILREEIKQ
eukprot:1136579-Pelagomonas_calceolata.AAC.3